MVSVIRQNTITNTAAALIPSGSPAIICNVGQDYGFEAIERTFVAAEIGAGANQTQDTASNPTMGFLFAQFQGAHIRRVMSACLVKSSAATNATIFERFAWATAAPHIYNIGFRIVNNDNSAASIALPGYNANYASLFLLDAGDNAVTQIAVGDVVRVLLELGSPKY